MLHVLSCHNILPPELLISAVPPKKYLLLLLLIFFFFAWPFWFSGWSCIGLRFCYALANAGLHSALWDIKSFMHCFWTMLFTILTKIFTHPGKSLNSGAQIIHIYPASRCRLLLPTFVKLLVTFRSLIICYLCNKCCGLADARRTALARVYRFRETLLCTKCKLELWTVVHSVRTVWIFLFQNMLLQFFLSPLSLSEAV